MCFCYFSDSTLLGAGRIYLMSWAENANLCHDRFDQPSACTRHFWPGLERCVEIHGQLNTFAAPQLAAFHRVYPNKKDSHPAASPLQDVGRDSIRAEAVIMKRLLGLLGALAFVFLVFPL
jgi:hypothetical protein